MKYLLLVSSMVFAIIGQLFMKKGVGLSSLAPNINSIIKTIFSPFVLAGLFSYGLSTLFWLFVLQKFPLSIAYPALSLTYVVIVILSFLIFQEPLSYLKVFGILFIIVGVFLLFK